MKVEVNIHSRTTGQNTRTSSNFFAKIKFLISCLRIEMQAAGDAKMFRATHLAFALVLSAASPSIAGASQVVPTDRVETAVLVRQGPNTDTLVVARLKPGQSAEVLDEVPGWYHVRLPDGLEGYVSKAWTREAPGGQVESLVPGASYKIHVIDVGTGLAVFVEGKDFALLYDAGSQDDLHDGNQNRVVAYIHRVRPDLTRIDYVILSHPHKDHVELLPDVFAAFQVGDVWDSGRVNATDGYCRFLKAVAAEPGVRYHDAVGSNQLRNVTFSGSGCSGTIALKESTMLTASPVTIGAGARMTALWRDAKNYADPNGNSVVVRLDLGNRRILLAGDAEGGERELPSQPPAPGSIEAGLLACCSSDIKADALVVGHHGSKTSSRDAFLDAVGARIFAISSGPHPYKTVRLPDAEIVADLEHRGTLYRTDVDDDACESNPNKIGPDADESPGGCDNILITIDPQGALNASYNRISD